MSKPNRPLLERIREYEQHYLQDYGFEKTMVWARQKYVASLIRRLNPETVLEIGCGYDQLFEQVADVASIREWIIVEPADVFSSMAREKLKTESRVRIIQGFVEEVVQQSGIQGIQLCICSGLLHEVKQPAVILQAAKEVLGQDGVLHVNVPNAESFHRMLACEMGLISSPYQMSDRNAALSQFHVFDINTIRALIEDVSLVPFETGGYFIKPFTHAQMEKIVDVLGTDILEGLWRMGAKRPELASEIYVNARRRG